MLKNVKTWQE